MNNFSFVTFAHFKLQFKILISAFSNSIFQQLNLQFFTSYPSPYCIEPGPVPEKCFTRVGSGLTFKHKTRLERLAKDEHSSLLRKSENYSHKKF